MSLCQRRYEHGDARGVTPGSAAAVDPNWLLAAGVIVVGLAGWQADQRRRRRRRRRHEDAVDWLLLEDDAEQDAMDMPDTSAELPAADVPADDHQSVVPVADCLSDERGKDASGRLAWRWLAICLLLAALFAGKAFWGTSATPPARAKPAAAAENRSDTQKIETIRVGQRVVAHDPQRDALPRTYGLVVDPATW